MDFLFSARFDCVHDEETVRYVSRKFNVWTHTGRKKATGWPAGPNALWLDSIARVRELPIKYKAVLTFEPDCVPMRRDWLVELSKEWDNARKDVVGHLVDTHINGNFLITGNRDFLGQFKACSSIKGWDICFAPVFRRSYLNTPLIRSYWNTPTFTRDLLDRESEAGTAMLHGCKDFSGLEYARQKLLK